MKLPSWVRGDPHASLKAVAGNHELPSFPTVTAQALELIRDDDSTDAQIAAVVASDPATSVRLLQTVNSAAYAIQRTVESVQQAVSLLGRNELESLLIASAVGRGLPSKPARGFDPKRFWMTASRRAALAQALAERVEPAIQSQCFTAALLQDMAIPVLAHHRDNSYGDLLEDWHRGGEDLALLERKKYDWDHALVATWMCDQWKVPAVLSRAIGAHHGTHEREGGALCPVNVVASLSEANSESDIEKLVGRAASELNLEEAVTLQLVEQSFRSVGSGMSWVT